MRRKDGGYADEVAIGHTGAAQRFFEGGQLFLVDSHPSR
jgi:hypothetical protein